MRHLLPAIAAVTALSVAIAPTAANSQTRHRHQPQRVASHVSLHLSGHTVLSGTTDDIKSDEAIRRAYLGS